MRPPYYAVIFTSERTNIDDNYMAVNERLEELAAGIDGFLGTESVRSHEGRKFGISISYWRNLEAIDIWRKNMEHLAAKEKGVKDWYHTYAIRISRVEQEKVFLKNGD